MSTVRKTATGDNSTVKSARRVLEILEYFDAVQRDLTLSEIVHELNYPASSTSALLHSLVELGYLARDEASHTFRPTPRVALLGSWINAAYFRDGALHRMLEELNRRTGETIILAVQTGLIARYIHVIQGTNPLRLYVKPGAVRPLGHSGIGRLFLSRYSLQDQRKIISRLNANRQQDEPHLEMAEILKDLANICKSGYALSANRITPGAGIVAMLLPGGDEARPLAVGIGGRAEVVLARHATFAEEIRSAIGLHLSGPMKPALRQSAEARR